MRASHVSKISAEPPEQIFRDIVGPVRAKTLERQNVVFTLKHIREDLIFDTRGRKKIAVSDVHRTIVDILAVITAFEGVTMRYRASFILIFLASLIVGCGGDDTAVAEKDLDAPADAAVAEPSASEPNYEAGPAFCGIIRPPEILAAFEFKLPLADVNVASELECHYNLDVPGAQVALLIYRINPIATYDLYKDSSQKTADIPNLGEEAILLGDAHVEVKLDDERALEVSIQVVNVSGGAFPMTPEESTEGLKRFAYMLSVRL